MVSQSNPAGAGPLDGPVRPGSEARQYPACKGTNCGCTDGRSHSRECEAEHDIAINGPGRCSVPMWMMHGLPAGTCDRPAYGMRAPCATFWNYAANEQQRTDGRYNGHVPHLACHAHGGPGPNADWIAEVRAGWKKRQ